MQNLGGLFCELCLDYFVKPIITKCGHSFCQLCIEEYFLYFETCPTCQSTVRSQNTYPVMALAQFVEQFIQKYDPESEPAFRNRIQKAHHLKAQRYLKCFPVGTKVDVRDNNHVWREGIIIRIISRVGESHKFIKVQYEGAFHRQQQDIRVNSERLASYGYYTKRLQFAVHINQNPEVSG